VTTTHAEIVQAARNLHDQIRHAGFRQAQDIFDKPTPFHPGNDVFYDHACPGDEVMEAPVLLRAPPGLWGVFGCCVRPPAGS